MSDIARALELKENSIDFVYDDEGAIATALESYAALKGQKNSYGIKQQNLTVDLFLTQGEIGEKTPLDLFIEQVYGFSEEDLALLKSWSRNFIGLFEIQAIEADCYRLMNWLTAKTYKVYAHAGMSEKETSRWQPGEIILCIIAPINEHEWFFFSDRIIKGKLSQPKLAVAVGEFRDNYPESLYADAPELLEQAWSSVAVYHEKFVDYMGSDRLTLPGYQLNKKIGELQQIMSREKLAEAGIDDTKSLEELLAESGKTEEEFAAAAEDMGADAEAVAKLMEQKNRSMVTPKVDLPLDIKQAESVTVYSEPRWGQMFLPNFEKFTDLLKDASGTVESSDDHSKQSAVGAKAPSSSRSAAQDKGHVRIYAHQESDRLVQKYLELPEANYYIWQQLKQSYSEGLTKLLQSCLNRPDFDLEKDLDGLLLQYQKSPTPELPAIASVPIHLNNLFEAALAQVQKTKSKTKKKKKKGFSI